MRSAALLPTGKTMNPRRPEGAYYYEPGQTAIIVQRRGAARGIGLKQVCLTSFGDLESWSLGSEHEMHHDQTYRKLGRGVVVGRIVFATGHAEGIVPNRALPHWVFK